MSGFDYRNDGLYAEGVALAEIAERYGTPCYVYSRAALTGAYREFDAAFAAYDHLVCYAVKANSTLAVLNVLARLGSGFDIVSGGELQRVLAAGGDPRKVVFSGVGKTAEEMRQALSAGILCFNIESESELERLEAVAAQAGKTASVSLRVNPDVDPRTHPYIATGLRQNKFGIPYKDALVLHRKARAMRHLTVAGIGCHIGSQLTEVAPFVAALDRLLELADRLQSEGAAVGHIDIGGGLGIRYRDESPPAVTEYAGALIGRLGGRALKLLLEPGRALTGPAGLLLTRVEYLKHGGEKHFAIVDAAMNDLMRPALYEAWHEVLPVVRAGGGQTYDIVGPVCESGDFLARARTLSLQEGSLLAIMSAGAYGMSMSSNYNTRPRAAEIMVDGAHAHLIRERESVAELMAREILLP
ncbi:MAG TPA: diaminopimelate decarboxylase [Burkholderiales bacterium]|nr:diaminopimelate decarboxylase [Burkholderiales bacterium]